MIPKRVDRRDDGHLASPEAVGRSVVLRRFPLGYLSHESFLPSGARYPSSPRLTNSFFRLLRSDRHLGLGFGSRQTAPQPEVIDQHDVLRLAIGANRRRCMNQLLQQRDH